MGYEVFAGNPHDQPTLQTIVATMEARHGVLDASGSPTAAWPAPRIWPGCARPGRSIIGARESEVTRFGSALAATDGWRTVHDGGEVKLTRHPETGATVIVCRSADRRGKERARHDTFSRRIEAALGRLAVRIARSKKPLAPPTVHRRIGRILQQNQRAAARFAIPLEGDGGPAGFRPRVVYNASFDAWAARSEGS